MRRMHRSRLTLSGRGATSCLRRCADFSEDAVAVGQFFIDLLASLPGLVKSPLGILGLALVLAAYLFAFFRKARFDSLLEKVESLPEKDRKSVIVAEMGNAPIPKNVSAVQWLRMRKQKYFFLSYALTVTYVFFIATFFIVSGRSGDAAGTPAAITVTGDGNAVATGGSTIGPPAATPANNGATDGSN
jgi:hypothetical protein